MGRGSKVVNNPHESSDFKEGQRLFHEDEKSRNEVQAAIDDLEKQHPQKLPDESVSNMQIEHEEQKGTETENVKPDNDTNDSAPEFKDTTVKDNGIQRKICCVVVPLVVLLVLGGVGAYLAYFFTHRSNSSANLPFNPALNMENTLSQALLNLQLNPIKDATVDDYARQLTLDLGSLVYLPDRPSTYQANSYYKPFEYTLPTAFINSGNPQIVNYTGWYDDKGVKAIQFTFSNGQTSLKSPIFGNLTAVAV